MVLFVQSLMRLGVWAVQLAVVHRMVWGSWELLAVVAVCLLCFVCCFYTKRRLSFFLLAVWLAALRAYLPLGSVLQVLALLQHPLYPGGALAAGTVVGLLLSRSLC